VPPRALKDRTTRNGAVAVTVPHYSQGRMNSGVAGLLAVIETAA
jgi:hypothetical protein